MVHTLSKLKAVLIVLAFATLTLMLAVPLQRATAVSPRALPSIVDVAVASDDFTTLVAALQCTGLDKLVSSNRQLTVFAPTDSAFADHGLDKDNVCGAFDTQTLSNILAYHVSPGQKYAVNVLNRKSVNMLNRQLALVDASVGTIANAPISATDIRVSNGVIHIIDKVMIP